MPKDFCLCSAFIALCSPPGPIHCLDINGYLLIFEWILVGGNDAIAETMEKTEKLTFCRNIFTQCQLFR